MTLKATISELSGKYYGTRVIIDDSYTNYELVIWIKPDISVPESLIPSPREIAFYGVEASVEDWINNVIITHTDPFGYTEKVPVREVICFESDHHESLASYKKALEIVSIFEQSACNIKRNAL